MQKTNHNHASITTPYCTLSMRIIKQLRTAFISPRHTKGNILSNISLIPELTETACAFYLQISSNVYSANH